MQNVSKIKLLLFIGVLFMLAVAVEGRKIGSGDYNNLAIDESDLVIAIGYDLVEYSPSAWNRIEKGQKNVIHIDYTPAEVDRNYIPNVEIIADLAGALYQLNNIFYKMND